VLTLAERPATDLADLLAAAVPADHLEGVPA
jgi:hypothetical protein